MTIHLTDGIKSIPLSALSPDAWAPADPVDQQQRAALAPQRLAQLVPVLFRCVDIRANAVSTIPFRLERKGKDVTALPESDALVQQLRTMLWYAEAGLCFTAAYWELGTNRAGKNLTPFWLSPWTVRPVIDPERGLTGFVRAGKADPLPVERVLHVFNPDPGVEAGPGAAPVGSVLAAAGVLRNLDRYTAAYFERGAIKMTLLSVPEGTKEPERLRLKVWWDGMIRGVQSAYRSVVISAKVEPTVIGSDPKDSAAPELVRLGREDVMVGMGVPQSLVFSNPLAGGTVAAERLNFYDFTVLPRVAIIVPAFNDQYLAQLGLRIIAEPEKLEAYQQAELTKAQGLMAVTGEPFLLPDEARAMLGKDPKSIAQQKLDMAIAEQRKAEGLPEPPPEPEPADAAAPLEEEPAPVDPTTLPPAEIKGRALDLARWEAKALKRGPGVAFRPDALDPSEAAFIRDALAGASGRDAIKAVFDAAQAEPGADLVGRERVLYDKVRRVLAGYGDAAAAAIVSGESVDLTGLPPALRAALIADLTATALEVMGGLADLIGPDFDPAQMGSLAADWARQYTYDLVAGLTDRSRAAVQQATAAFFQGMRTADVAALLSPAFGERRADAIAATEVTRAAAQATVMYQQYLATHGLAYDLTWLTSTDERTCAICTPRGGQRQGDGWDEPPPAHPRCRCRVGLVPTKGEGKR